MAIQGESKGDAARERDAKSQFPYPPKVCEAGGGHQISTRTTGPAIVGGRLCARCGVEVPNGGTLVTAGATLSDPLNLLNGKTA
jgi:hypothetical protein